MKTLREYKVTAVKCRPGEHAVDPESHDNLGTRTKLGGEPDWEQGEDHAECSGCFKKMTFVAQIDSIEHWSSMNPNSRHPIKDGQDFMFGDVGLIYVFFCFDCLETKSVFQCG